MRRLRESSYYLFVMMLGVAVSMSLWHSTARAQETVTVDLVADKTELTVGDLVNLTLEITHPESYQVFPGRLPNTWGNFEVRSQSRPEIVENKNGVVTTRQNIQVTLFSPGEFETPAFPVTFRDDQGQTFEELAPRISMQVAPVLGEDDTELRDIKAQAGLGSTFPWLWVVAAVLVLAGAGLVVWALYPRSRRPRAATALTQELFPDTRTPFEIAMSEIARIEGLHLPEKGQFKEHYTLLSDALRYYLTGAYGAPALDRTTNELRSNLRHTEIRTEYVRHIVEVLRESELVKFARFSPEIPDARKLTSEVRGLVELTRPAPVTEPGVNGAVMTTEVVS